MFGKKHILRIDPGLAHYDIGVVDGAVGRPPVFVVARVVRTSPDLDVAHRLLQVEAGLERWFTEYTPNVVAIERVFAQHSTTSVIDTVQAVGVTALVATRHELPIASHTPSEVKAAITDSGRADKPQVTSMVTTILKLDVPPRPADATDALVLVVCHAWRGGYINRYTVPVAAVRGKR